MKMLFEENYKIGGFQSGFGLHFVLLKHFLAVAEFFIPTTVAKFCFVTYFKTYFTSYLSVKKSDNWHLKQLLGMMTIKLIKYGN